MTQTTQETAPRHDVIADFINRIPLLRELAQLIADDEPGDTAHLFETEPEEVKK